MGKRKGLKDPRKLPYKKAPGIVPQELDGKAFPCEKCGTDIKVPWLEKLPFPSQPIEPDTGGGHWVPVSIPLQCNAKGCTHETLIDVPRKEKEATWTLYGDEAGRYIREPHSLVSKEQLHFFGITLVGLHRDLWDTVSRQVQEAKSKIKPEEAPESWSHHFTQIWSSSSKSQRFALPTKDSKIEYGKTFASIIRDARPSLVSFTISSCIVVPKNNSERKKAIKWQKQEMFSQAILISLQQMRQYKKGVGWIFDNVKDSTFKNPTEGWASECFLGLQYTRLFAWLCAGTSTLEPNFVKPGSHFLLEIADFISYCVAREFEMATKKIQTELPSSLLGEAFYHGIARNGSAYYKWSNSFPLKELYDL